MWWESNKYNISNFLKNCGYRVDCCKLNIEGAFMENNQKCPICGCKEIGKGRQAGHGSMVPVGNMWTGSTIISDICTECFIMCVSTVIYSELFILYGG